MKVGKVPPQNHGIRRLRESPKNHLIKSGQDYSAYVVEYRLFGQRKPEWKSDLTQAKQAAIETCRKIAGGEQLVLKLRSSDGSRRRMSLDGKI